MLAETSSPLRGRGLGLRDQVRRVPDARRARPGPSPAALPQRARRHRRLPGDRGRPGRASGAAISSSTARWWCSTRGAARASSGCSSASRPGSEAAARRPPPGHPLRLRLPGRGRARPAGAAPAGAQGGAAAASSAASRRSASSTTWPPTASRSSPRSARLGLEGIVAKRADAPYVPGRSRDWRKIRIERTGDFVVVGYTRAALGEEGGLHLAAADGGTLRYAGRVGHRVRGRRARARRARCWRPSSATPRPATARRAAARTSGWSRGSCARSATRRRPRPGSCATRCSSASAALATRSRGASHRAASPKRR